MTNSANEISQLLAQRIQSLVVDLFPAGRREGNEWRIGSVGGEAGRSTAVHLHGPKAGVWADFSAGTAGDALDLVAHALYGGDRRQALAWARHWLGLAPNVAVSTQPPAAPATKTHGVRFIAAQAHAWKIFSASQVSIAGTPPAAYLAGRGIDLAELRRQPRALRFHAALYNREADRPLPAMVAAVSGIDGKFVAVHRTWLECRGGVWGKARLDSPKMLLGSPAGGSIRLWRGSSGKPLAEAPDGERIVIAEGIETALSIAIACPERRIIAAVSLANMGSLVLPPSISTITLAADNDAPDSQAAQALQKIIDRFIGEGRRVLIARSPRGSDFNDILTAKAG